MMDESKEGLLSPSQRYHSSYDAEAAAGADADVDARYSKGRHSISSDMDDSDLDATEFLTTDPLHDPSDNHPKPFFLTGQRNFITLSTLRRPFRNRSRCCITTCTIVLIIWLMLGAGGAFV